MTSNHDVYVSLDTSNDIEEGCDGKSACIKTKEQIDAVYHAFVDEESKLPDFKVLRPFSAKQAEDIGEAFRGDYKGKYHIAEEDVFLLPQYQFFEERLDKSTFDDLNIEIDSIKFRFFAPFIIKAELKPGLAFTEVLLTLIHILTMVSILTNGMTILSMMIGGGTLFLLMTIVHFWYGMSRYPSIWNSFVPHGLKGSHVDHNFSQIRDICSHRCTGYEKTKSQLVQFLISLPFTIIYHAIGFLVTATYFALKISKSGGNGSKLPPPVFTGLFLSNIFVTAIWFLGGRSGIVFCTCTVVFSQRVYDSLLFNRDLKDFCISLVFGNLLVIQEKLKRDEKEIALTENSCEYDVEAGIQIRNEEENKTKLDNKTDMTGTPNHRTQAVSLPSLLGTNTDVSANSFVDTRTEGDATQTQDHTDELPENDVLTTIQNFCSLNKDEEGIETNDQSQSVIFSDDSLSHHSDSEDEDGGLQHLTTVHPEKSVMSFNNEEVPEKIIEKFDTQKEKEVQPSTPRSNKKKFFGISRRMLRSPRRESFGFDRNFPDDEISTEFVDPSDVHLSDENHPGTIEWRTTVSESIHRFRIRSYTLRKHNWVMNQMHGRSFFIKESDQRRRKLKRKEIKEHCKTFHDKQIHLNSQISGILDDLKDLKRNHNTNKNNSDHTRNSNGQNTSRSISDHTRNSFANIPLEMDENNHEEMEEKNEVFNTSETYTMSDSNFPQANKSDAASLTKDSILDSSKESSVSTLTESCATHDFPGDIKNVSWIQRSGAELKERDGNGDAGSFRDAIHGLLECTPWMDNMISLRESGSINQDVQGEEVEVELPSIWPCDDEPQNKAEDVEREPTSDNGQTTTNLQSEPYWRSLVDKEGTIKEQSNSSERSAESGFSVPSADMKSKKRRNLYPWRSDLQKKKLEKARESRSKDKALSMKYPKRIITKLRKKKKNESYQVVSEGQLSRPPSTLSEEGQRNGHKEITNNKNLRTTRQNQKSKSPFDDIVDDTGDVQFRGWTDEPEVQAETNKGLKQTSVSSPNGRDFSPEATVQREEQREEQNFLPDVLHMNVNRILHYE